MPDPPRPLEHSSHEDKNDAALAEEAHAHLATNPTLQVMAELLARLRGLDAAWWTPEVLRGAWGAAPRMTWLRQRADLRQKITSALTGLAPRAARKKAPEFQASLIESVLEEGDIAPRAFEAAFAPIDLAVYAPAGGYWRLFRERMPWTEDTPVNQELVTWLLEALLAEKSAIDGMTRRPILTAWDVRTAIEGKVWHTKIPIDVRIAIDEARLAQEKARPGEPFHASQDLAIAIPEVLVESIPLRDLTRVFDAAERAMGLRDGAATPTTPPAAGPGTTRPPAIAPPARGSERGAPSTKVNPIPLNLLDEPARPRPDLGEPGPKGDEALAKARRGASATSTASTAPPSLSVAPPPGSTERSSVAPAPAPVAGSAERSSVAPAPLAAPTSTQATRAAVAPAPVAGSASTQATRPGVAAAPIAGSTSTQATRPSAAPPPCEATPPFVPPPPTLAPSGVTSSPPPGASSAPTLSSGAPRAGVPDSAATSSAPPRISIQEESFNEEDLEQTNPWLVPAGHELGLDEGELQKLVDPPPGEPPITDSPLGSGRRQRGKPS